MPEFPGIQWERNKRGGFEAWYVPEGKSKRKDKTYLGYIGKRQLNVWAELSQAEMQRTIGKWVKSVRADKGL